MASNVRRIWLVALVLFLAGCATNEISNLSPRVLRRNPEGLYILEARWDSNWRAVRGDTMTPFVVIGSEFHPMQRSAVNADCWQASIPVPPGQRFVNYRFKFDYEKAGFGRNHPDSKRSRFYQLEIAD